MKAPVQRFGGFPHALGDAVNGRSSQDRSIQQLTAHDCNSSGEIMPYPPIQRPLIRRVSHDPFSP